MATISKAGIVNGQAIQAQQILNIIEALDGTSSTTISATGSLQGTSSYALSSSYAVTASYVLSGGSTFPFNGNAIITGSLLVSGSGVTITGSLKAPNITGSLQGSSSYALSSSYAVTASYALSGGTTYPSITDDSDIVTIYPTSSVNIQSTTLGIYGNLETTLGGNYLNMSNSIVNIGTSGGTLIFYNTDNGKTPITRPGAIPDASAIDVVTTLNALLQVMRDFNLIAT
jgi:hypothetical protein